MSAQTALAKGLEVRRHFSSSNVSPFTTVEWEERTATITNFKGDVIFEQKNVRVPKEWSATATNIVVSKYFFGKVGTPERETGIDQLVERVVTTITMAGVNQGHFTMENAAIFADELAYLLLHQLGAFNSPVWFNVGCDQLEPNAQASSWHWGLQQLDADTSRMGIVHGATGYKNPQCSACFINAINDSMEGIMALATTEAMLFKFGSGTGTNFSPLRSSKEAVSGGGTASGPLSFMKGLDAFAGVIKSGGKTRRAAKMAILNADHPDIEEFINCKLLEDKKAQALMREGYDGTSGPDSEAYSSIFYQNANNSVRATDQFMLAVQEDCHFQTIAVKTGKEVKDYKARDLMYKIAEATWACGDPGMQFDDTINKWHTCKNTDRINASNPCSEYMFLDNSACNLASLNLMKFLNPDMSFDAEGFRLAVGIFIIAQDILVDKSGYPTEEIAINSHDYRPLGLGYANLGALLMALGLAYDSDAGRAYAAGVTALMTGSAYAMSAHMAASLEPLDAASSRLGVCTTGACPGWFTNKAPFLDVIQMHCEKSRHLSGSFVPNTLREAAENAWSSARVLGNKYGYRNAQVTVLAPTGTIGFMMDCDTTGIEPELALIKYKKMVGGGVLKIVNERVSQALWVLGYHPELIEDILKYIDVNGTIEGAPDFNPKDLPVFDTAFRPSKGTRSIHYMGHIKMMAATQPFLSGAISKTVNLPNEATVEDIEEAYIQSWKLGLKSVAIYRDGSKTNQPVVTKKIEVNSPEALNEPIGGLVSDQALQVILEHREQTVPSEELLELVRKEFGEYLALPVAPAEDMGAPPHAMRHRLPDTRQAVTHKFSIAGHDGYFTIGLYQNGQPGEIFITMAKEGSTISGFMDSFALVFSMALQHGVPLATLVSKLSHTRFEPSGWTGNPDVGYAKSPMDYMARWLGRYYLGTAEAEAKTESTAKALSSTIAISDSPPCPECGCITVRSGSCYKCLECGSTTGCS